MTDSHGVMTGPLRRRAVAPSNQVPGGASLPASHDALGSERAWALAASVERDAPDLRGRALGGAALREDRVLDPDRLLAVGRRRLEEVALDVPTFRVARAKSHFVVTLALAHRAPRIVSRRSSSSAARTASAMIVS